MQSATEVFVVVEVMGGRSEKRGGWGKIDEGKLWRRRRTSSSSSKSSTTANSKTLEKGQGKASQGCRSALIDLSQAAEVFHNKMQVRQKINAQFRKDNRPNSILVPMRRVCM